MSEAAVPAAHFERVTELRVAQPRLAAELLRRRRERAPSPPPRPLVVLAADHPARRVTSIGDDPVRMADRHDYLSRIVRVLSGAPVHGVMATPDVLEELALLDHLRQADGGMGFLAGRLLVGSVNRGGLDGLTAELDDPPTSLADLDRAVEVGLDAVKLLVRVPDPSTPDDERAVRTLHAAAQLIDDARRRGLPVHLEPLAVERTAAGRLAVRRDPDVVARVVGVASGLGSSSEGVWMKLPCTPSFERVGRACTHPILLLGGPARPDPSDVIREIVSCAQAAPNVWGALIGRSLLYPGDGDPAEAATGLVHALGA